MNTPIVDFVVRYAQSGTSRLHMPGHKGQQFLGFEPYDITEIKGADELYEAEGIIAQSEANATKLFGTAHTYYSTEGSSQCIRAMLFLALQAAPKTGERPVLLAARNAHKALLYAAALQDFDIRWLWPAPEDSGALCSCPVRPDDLKAALDALSREGKKPFGVYLTSPDYLGGVQDIAALSAVCKAEGVPLLVDNAHGAYLRFLPTGSRHPIALGAAMCCDSGHKTLPVLTGGAYLHLGESAPIKEESAVRNALALFGSTSPSYLILQSLDRCNRYLAEGYPIRLMQCMGGLQRLRRELNEFAQQAGAVRDFALDGGENGTLREPLKLTLDASVLNMTGTALAEELRRSGIECEYADPRYLVLMFTPENPPRDYEQLETAIRNLCENLHVMADADNTDEAACAAEFTALMEQAETRRTIRQAVFAPQERIPCKDALGRVCAMPAVSCPPAIPIAVSGELITPAAVKLFERYGIETVEVTLSVKA